MNFILIMFLLWAGPAEAKMISKPAAVDCIIGEAEGEPYIGKLAVAQALLNRGTTRGVYGRSSIRVLKRLYSSKVFVDAVRAWEEAPNKPDVTNGANSWYSEEDMKKDPGIDDRCRRTAVIGHHTFFYCEGV